MSSLRSLSRRVAFSRTKSIVQILVENNSVSSQNGDIHLRNLKSQHGIHTETNFRKTIYQSDTHSKEFKSSVTLVSRHFSIGSQLNTRPEPDTTADVDTSQQIPGKPRSEKITFDTSLVEGKTVDEFAVLMTKLTTQGDPQAVDAFRAWQAVPGNKPNTLSFNLYLHALNRSGATFQEMGKAFQAMLESGVQPNIFTYNTLLRVASNEHNSFAAEDVLRRMDVAPNAETYNMLISVCAGDRRVGSAVEYMQAMLRSGFVPNKHSYNQVLVAASRLRRTRDALAILKEIKTQNFKIPPNTLAELLFAACEAEDSECCLIVLELIASSRLPCDKGSLLVALNLAARSGNVDLSDMAWKSLSFYLGDRPADPIFHLARIQSFATGGHFSRAFGHLLTLEKQIYSSEDSISSPVLCPFTSLRPLVTSLSRGVGVLDNAYYLLADHKRGSGLETEGSLELVSRSALNCVIAGCSFVRDTERAQQTFEEMWPTFNIAPDLHSYNALIEGFAKTGQAKRVEELISELESKGLKSSSLTYSLKAFAYVTSKQAEKAVETVQEMESHGHLPSRELLMAVYRRCKREPFEGGIEVMFKLTRKFGYRISGEGRRAALSEELSRLMKENPHRIPYGNRDRYRGRPGEPSLAEASDMQ